MVAAGATPDAAPPENGANATPARETREPHEPSGPREYHTASRDTAAAHEATPIAHFEPTPKPESGQSKPYVVWSSAPTPKDTGRSDSEE